MQSYGGGYGRIGRGHEPAPGRLERQIAFNERTWRR
jgi:hypothetical protein